MEYNKNRNYKDEIDAAVRSGNYVLAGSLERERNAKIDGEGLGYEKTYTYTPYIDKDYGVGIQEKIRNGASAAAVKSDLDMRKQKSALDGYTQYADDSINKQAEQYIALQNSLTQPFSYNTGLANVNAREKQLDDILGDIKNYKKFEYNPETDPLYAALSAQYTKNGQRAMQDTIAQMAARTGGLASSYAASAGNQAYANYMSELGGRIPELQQLAYQMYSDDYNKQLQQAQIAQSLYDSALARYQNDRSFAYGQYADNRNMNYNLLNDMISGARYGDETAYNREQDKKQWDYGVSQDEYTKKQNTQNQILSWIDQGISAEYIPQSIKDASGWTDDEINKASGAVKKNKKTTTSNSGSPKISSAYDDVVEELWGETDAAVIDDFLKTNVAAKKITQAEADEIRKAVLEGSGDETKIGPDEELGTNYNAVLRRATNMSTGEDSYPKIIEYLNRAYENGRITEAGLEKIIDYFGW